MQKNIENTEERILAGLRRCNKILRHGKFGHHGKARILGMLKENGPMTQKSLQEEAEIRSSSISELLKKMEEHGMVTRKPDPNDQRGLVVEITDKGTEIANEIRKEKGEKAHKFFGALTPEEQEQFANMLDKIQDSWREEGMFYGDAKRHRMRHSC